MNQKWLPWAVGALLLLLLLALIFLFFPPAAKKNTNTNLAFPDSGTGTRTQQTQVETGGIVPVSNGQNGGTGSAGASVQSSQGFGQNSYAPRYVPVEQTYSFPAVSSQRSGQGSAPPATFAPVFFHSLITNPVLPGSVQPVSVLPPSYTNGTGPRVIGHSRDGRDVIFNPQTGDLFVGDLHFNFTGTVGIPGSTSDVVGDPDNLAIGTALGTLAGSLLGNPATGLTFGTAIGSNLIQGHTLQDLGIGIVNGMPSIGGTDIVSALSGSVLGNIGSGLSGALGLGGGAVSGVFGGTLTLVSPCDVGTLYLVAGIPYSGPLMWMPGVSNVPPYLNAMGTPPIVGPALGHYVGASACVIGNAPAGGGPVMYGYGTAL